MLAAAASTAPSGIDWGTFWAYAAVVLVVGTGLAAWVRMSVSALGDKLEPRLAKVEIVVAETCGRLGTVVTDVAVLRETATRTETTLSDFSDKLDRVGSTADRMDGQLAVLVTQLGPSPQPSPQPRRRREPN